MKRKMKSVLSVILVLTVVISVIVPFNITASAYDVATGSDIVAVLYDNTELVFQHKDRGVDITRTVTYLFNESDFSDNATELGLSTQSSSETAETAKKAIPWDSYRNIITTVTFKDKIQPTSTVCWFEAMTKLKTFKYIENLDTSKVVNMYRMFYNCTGITDGLDVSYFDTSECKVMWDMFCGCTNITKLDVSKWNVVNLEKAAGTFYKCSKISYLDVSNWSTPNLIDMQGIFRELPKVKTFDLSKWKFDNLKKFRRVFTNDKALESITFPSSNYTPNLDECYQAFMGCTSLKRVDLNGFTFDNVTSDSKFIDMFKNCTALEVINANGFSGLGKSITSTTNMFNGCKSLRSLDLSGIGSNFSKSTKTNMLKDLDSLVEIKLGNNFSSGAGELTAVTWKNIDTKQVLSQDQLIGSYQSSYTGTWVTEADINFYGNGGTPKVQSVRGYVGDPIEFDFTASRKGYQFDGWYTEKSGGEELTTGGTPQQWDYYANWLENKYNLTLNGNGGTTSDNYETKDAGELSYSQFYQLNSNLFTNPDSTLVLSSWNTRLNGKGTSYGPNEDVSRLTDKNGGEITLYAQWHTPDITVTFDSQGGSEVEKRYYTIGDKYGELNEPVKAGYVFLGWYTLKEGETDLDGKEPKKITADSDVTEASVLFAHWAKNPTLTLNANGGKIQGEDTCTLTVKYNSEIGELAEPVRDNAAFCGWFTAQTDGEEVTSAAKITEDTTLYAHWGYKPEIETNGGNLIKTVVYDVSDTSNYYISDLPEVEKNGSVFSGWYFKKTGDAVTAGISYDLSETGNIIEARWTESDIVKVTLDADGGECSRQSIDVYKGKPILELPNPTKDGYEFKGWFIEDTEYTKESTFSENVTLTAKWTEKTCTLNFDAGDGTLFDSADSEIKVVPGNKLSVLPGANREGYILEGWYPNDDYKGDKLTTDTEITDDMNNTTYYAKWTDNVVKDNDGYYSYYSRWGTPSGSGATVYGDNLTLHPTTNGEISAILEVYINLNPGASELPVGSINIKIPKYLFKNWEDNDFGTCNLTDLPEKDSSGAADAKFVYEESEDEDCYIISNSKSITSGGGILRFNYTADAKKIKGGYTDENGNFCVDYMTKTFNVDATVKNGENEILSDTREFTIEAHTQVQSTVKKESDKSYIYYKWDSSWGTEPDDADEYFYVKWYLIDSESGRSTQDYTVTWSEDTVHDGTVIYTNGYNNKTCYVVTKHERPASSGNQNIVTVSNEAVVTETWKSEYETRYRVNSSVSVYIPSSSTSGYRSLKKHIANDSNYIEGGQDEIMTGTDVVTLPYIITYSESYNQEAEWNSDDGVYVAPEREIIIRDGNTGDVTISDTSDSNDMYEWNPVSSVNLTDADYYFSSLDISLTEYDSVILGDNWVSPYEHTDHNSYDGAYIYIRRSGDTAFKPYKEISLTSDQTVTLPDDTIGFEIHHNSTYYASKLEINADLCLKRSSKVLDLVGEDMTAGYNTIIKNKCASESKTTVDNEEVKYECDSTAFDAYLSVYELNVNESVLYTGKSCSSNSEIEHGNSCEVFPAYISSWNYNTDSTTNPKYMNSGVFYDLLPIGAVVVEGSVYILPVTNRAKKAQFNADKYDTYINSSDKIGKEYFDVRYVSDWQGSGQTMMIVTVKTPDSISTVGYNVFYKMSIANEDIKTYGTKQTNNVAFVDTSENQANPAAVSEGFSSLESKYRPYYQSLNNAENGRIAYSYALTSLQPPTIETWGFEQKVNVGSMYSYSGITGLNKSYIYRLSFSMDNSESQNLVLYDVLEKGKGDAVSEWYGKFASVDTSAVSQLTTYTSDGISTDCCSPVVYYSTKTRNKFSEEDFVLNDSTLKGDDPVWTTVCPADKSTVTAVAIDCSQTESGEDFVLGSKEILNVYINMTTPSSIDNNDITAINQSYIYGETTDSVEIKNNEISSVMLHRVIPEFSKSSMPVTGTEESPAGVLNNSVITYTLSVYNDDETMTLNDVIVEDEFDSKLSLNNTVQINFGTGTDSIDIDKSPRVKSYTIKENSLSVTISSIQAGETVNIIVPATVKANAGGDIQNTSYITAVDGTKLTGSTDESHAYDIVSETTYHTVKPMQAKVYKTSTSGKALSEAVLEIYEGNSIENGEEPLKTLTSGPSTIEFEEWDNKNKVTPGTYLLHEKEAPAGYEIADDIVFTIDAEGLIYINGVQVSYVEMTDKPSWCVKYHENQPDADDVIFRQYDPEGESVTVDAFYDIPTFAGDEYVFKGWYYDSNNDDDDNPIIFNDDENAAYGKSITYTGPEDVDIYAHWIKVGTVEKDKNDEKTFSGSYRGFGTVGVQIREAGMLDTNYEVTFPEGMRYVTSLSNALLSEIDNVSEKKVKIEATNTGNGAEVGVEYGYAVGVESDIQSFISHYGIKDTSSYNIMYQGENVNGIDTRGTVAASRTAQNDYRYVRIYNCTQGTGQIKQDHRSYTDYRLYTFVLTYENDAAGKARKFDARAYLRYYDANGLLRTFFNTYKKNTMYGGCLCSYNQAYAGIFGN